MLSQVEPPAAVLRLLGIPHRTEPIPGRVRFLISQWICGCSMVQHGELADAAIWSSCSAHSSRSA
jgi:hypothetical protein